MKFKESNGIFYRYRITSMVAWTLNILLIVGLFFLFQSLPMTDKESEESGFGFAMLSIFIIGFLNFDVFPLFLDKLDQKISCTKADEKH